MPQPSDKQTYSVDEMMDRLRDEERNKQAKDEGELVTREDGTQVLKVKKRKRRTTQEKHKKAARKKKLGVIRLVLAVALPLILGLAALLITARYHSGSYAQNLNKTISETVGANAKVARFSPLFNRASAARVVVAWPDGKLLDQLQVGDLKGDLKIASFLTGDLAGENLKSAKGEVTFSRREGRNVSSRFKGEALSLTGFKSYQSDDFSFYFGRRNSPFRVLSTSVRLEPQGEFQRLHLAGGDLVAGSWGELPIKRGIVELFPNYAMIRSLDIESETASVRVSGQLDSSLPSQELAVEVVEGDFQSLAGQEAALFFEGNLKEGSGSLSFDSWDFSSHELSFSSPTKYLTVKHFSFLEKLEEFYGDSGYKKIEFENRRDLNVVRGPGWVEIRDFYLSEIGVVGLRGTVRLEGDVLSGKISVGLPEHKRLILRPEQVSRLTSGAKMEDGFAWLPVSLSGRSDHPQDDFVKHLEAAPQAASEGDLFEELTR